MSTSPSPSPDAPLRHSPARACRVEDVPRWDIETDVAVIGFGISGACAAIEAKSAGAEVLIFEVAAASGGSAALSGGDIYLGGNGGTPAQKAAGFDDSTEDLFKYLMLAGGPGADAQRARMAIPRYGQPEDIAGLPEIERAKAALRSAGGT